MSTSFRLARPDSRLPTHENVMNYARTVMCFARPARPRLGAGRSAAAHSAALREAAKEDKPEKVREKGEKLEEKVNEAYAKHEEKMDEENRRFDEKRNKIINKKRGKKKDK